MGVAILWVVLFHSQLVLPDGVGIIKEIGYGGVDIFMLLSGCGIYYSLTKSDEVIPFYLRRIRRLFPAYLPFIVCWCVYKLNYLDVKIIEKLRIVIGNICMTGWINDVPYQFNWYVQVICGLYFLAPLFYALVCRCRKSWQCMLLFFAVAVAGIPFFCDLSHLMGVSRVPIFLMGMMWAHMVRSDEKSNGKWAKRAFLVLAMMLGFVLVIMCIYRYPDTLWAYGTWWYPFLLITPGLCYVLAQIFEWMGRAGKICLLPMRWIGKASFEIYLIHIAAYEIVPSYREVVNNRQWLKLMAVAVIAGIFYHLLIEGIKGLWGKLREQREKSREESHEENDREKIH